MPVSKKSFMSVVPDNFLLMIYGPDNGLIALGAVTLESPSSLGQEVIDLLAPMYEIDSQITPETLNSFAEILLWEEHQIRVMWKK